MSRAIEIGKAVIKEVNDDDCQGLAAEMAYHLVLASAPMLIFILTLFGLFGHQQDIIDQIMFYAAQVIPAEGQGILRGLINTVVSGSSGGLAIVSLLGAFWAASNGAVVIIKALRRAYDVDPHDESKKLSFIQQKFLALLIVGSLGLAMFLASNLLIFGNVLFDNISNWLNLGPAVGILLNVLRWAIVIALIIGFSAFVYRVVPGFPGKKMAWKSAFAGSVLFVTIWLVVSVLFSLYVENFGKYNEMYGAIGAIIVMMLWLFLTSLAFLAGGELNSVLEGYSEETRPKIQHRPARAS